MDKFESQFEDLDVQSQYMEKSISNTTTQATPQDEVERLMHQVADEHGLELKLEGAVPASAITAAASSEQDELNERLAKLRNPAQQQQ
jgi:charged multivesicular body protein 1